MNLPRLFSIVLYACLGETTIPLVSWAWGAFGISYTKRTITTLLHDAAKKGSRISIPKLDHEMLRDYFDGNLWRSDLFRIQSGFCQSDTIRSRFCQSGPIRSGFCQSDPIQSGPGFVNTRFHVTISEGSHVAVRISPKATDIDIDKFFCCDCICIHQYSRHMQNEYPTSLKVQRQQWSASLAVVHGHWSASRFFEYVGAPGVVLPYISYIGMCGPKGYGFSAVLVINRVSILADLAILVIIRVWVFRVLNKFWSRRVKYKSRRQEK